MEESEIKVKMETEESYDSRDIDIGPACHVKEEVYNENSDTDEYMDFSEQKEQTYAKTSTKSRAATNKRTATKKRTVRKFDSTSDSENGDSLHIPDKVNKNRCKKKLNVPNRGKNKHLSKIKGKRLECLKLKRKVKEKVDASEESKEESDTGVSDDEEECINWRHPQAFNAPSRAHLIKATCRICGLGFTSETRRVLHVIKAHDLSSCKCLQEFATKEDLREHHTNCEEYKAYKQEQHSNSLTACDICGNKMEKRRLADHKKKHGINENDDIFYCSQCPKFFNRVTTLILHEKFVHLPETERIQCPLCESRLKQKHQLVCHVKTHRDLSGIAPPADGYTCPMCDHKDVGPAGIKEHILTEHGVKQKRGPVGKRQKPLAPEPLGRREKKKDPGATCPICQRHVARKTYLKTHMASHDVTQQIACDICERLFASKTLLKNHKRVVHNPSERLKCTVCFKSLASTSNMKKHMMIHNNEFAFECHCCGKSCRSSWDLKVHERVHTGEKPFKCEQCGKAFSDVSNMRVHVRRHHKQD